MHFDLARYDVSAEYYLKGVEIARMRGDDGMVAEGYSNAAYSLFKGGKVSESIPIYEQSIAVRGRIGAFKELVENYNRLGLIYNDAKDYEKSLSYFEKKLDATVKVGDKEKIFDAYYDLGLVANRVPRYDLAIEYFHKGIEIAGSLGNESAVAGMQEGLAKAFTAIGRYDDAIEAWSRRLATCEKFEDVRNRASTLEGLALTHSKAGHHEDAASLYEKAAIDRSALGEDPYSDYMNAGRACMQAGRIEDATWLFETAFASVQSRDDKSRSSEALHELASALERSGRLSEAIDRLTKEIEIRRDLQDETGLQSARDAINTIKQRADAEMHDAKSKPGDAGTYLLSGDSSPAALHRALAVAESLQQLKHIAEIASKLGMHYHDGKHSDMAIRFFEKSLTAYRLLGEIKNMTKQVFHIGKCLRAREQYNDAIAKLEENLRVMDESHGNIKPTLHAAR
nr:tetratricopeptide repeat protein [Candidatus Sigynarchaeota archaeon]